jgi:hypothetical protein
MSSFSETNERLFVACKTGNLEGVKDELQRGGDRDFFKDDEISLVTAACTNGHHAVVRELLERGATFKDEGNLKAAIEGGYDEVVVVLLQAGIDPLEDDALEIACDYRNCAIILELLATGDNFLPSDYARVLKLAIEEEDPSLVQAVLETDEKRTCFREIDGYKLLYTALSESERPHDSKNYDFINIAEHLMQAGVGPHHTVARTRFMRAVEIPLATKAYLVTLLERNLPVAHSQTDIERPLMLCHGDGVGTYRMTPPPRGYTWDQPLYYECIIKNDVSGEEEPSRVHVGVATLDWKPSTTYHLLGRTAEAVGTSAYSCALDCQRDMALMDGGKKFSMNRRLYDSSYVIGVLVQIDSRVTFYYNGHFECNSTCLLKDVCLETIRSTVIVPVVSLWEGAEVELNFGSNPFIHPPDDGTYMSFEERHGEKAEQCGYYPAHFRYHLDQYSIVSRKWGIANQPSSYAAPMYDWCWALTQKSEKLLKVVEEVLRKNASCIRQLCDAQDEHHRRAMDVAVYDMKQLLQKYLCFMGRFDLLPGGEIHQSATCRVVKAVDCTPPAGRAGAGAGAGVTHGTDHRVVLKFMRNRSEFDKELTARERLGDQCVVEILAHFSASVDSLYQSEIVSKGLEQYPFVIVMPECGRTLSDVVLHGYVQPRDTDKIVSIMIDVCRCLQDIHAVGLIHGDVKPLDIITR